MEELLCIEQFAVNELMHAKSGLPRRVKVYIKSYGRCHYCERELSLSTTKRNSVTIEHLQCRSANGSNSIDNIVAACLRCNCLRGHAPLEWFEWFLEHYGIEHLPEYDTKRFNRLKAQINNVMTHIPNMKKKPKLRMTARK